ncbi:MAG: hypothetical protein ABEH58_06170 [Haloplanus sp.]
MRIRMTDERERRLRELMDATGENTKAGALDVAVKHYLADLRNKREVADQLDGEAVEALSTPFLPLERTRETSVGRE